jgi:hypothetical protein
VTEPFSRRRSRTALLAVTLTGMLGFSSPAIASDRPDAIPDLSVEQQVTLARAFAPTLVFHPEEEYFPVSSMDSLTGDGPVEGWASRVGQYRALSPEEKLRRAALAYRVFSRVRDGHAEVVVEYWCHYVYNAFSARVAWLPYSVGGNHANDLERLYLVLRMTQPGSPAGGATDEAWARRAFRVHQIVANAHDGGIPPNQYEARNGEAVALPVNVLVERGSHAMAPDLDNDGRFTPGIDSTDILKLQWGIRDRGNTWGWYRDSYQDGRSASAVRLCAPAQAPDPAGADCVRYALYHADDLQRWFQELRLSEEDRDALVGRTPWLVRTFGDFRVEELMVPEDPPNGRVLDRMLRRRVRSESGFVAGFTTVDHAPTLVLGRRDFWEVASRRSPDFLTEFAALLPSSGPALIETTLWGSYSLDAVTNLLFGAGWFSEASTVSPVIGGELRVGRFRVRPQWRLSDNGFDTRVITTF